MGLVGLPASLFLYWLLLHYKKGDWFPKRGLLRLLIAGAVSVVLAVVLTLPIDGTIALVRMGILSNLSEWIRVANESPEAFAEMIQNASSNVQPSFLWVLIGMFFSAGLLEEGLKFLTCRVAIRNVTKGRFFCHNCSRYGAR